MHISSFRVSFCVPVAGTGLVRTPPEFLVIVFIGSAANAIWVYHRRVPAAASGRPPNQGS